jgi:hypothetical protein
MAWNRKDDIFGTRTVEQPCTASSGAIGKRQLTPCASSSGAVQALLLAGLRQGSHMTVSGYSEQL